MSADVHSSGEFQGAVRELPKLCDFGGTADAFWAAYLSAVAGVSGAKAVVVLRAGPQDSPGWKRVLAWPPDGRLQAAHAQALLGTAADVAEACVVQGCARRAVKSPAGGAVVDWCIGARIEAATASQAWVAVLLLAAASEAAAEEALRRVQLLAHLPAVYQLRRRADRSEAAVSHFASVLELLSRLNDANRFLAVAMTLCNELASRHQCSRVSLGWLDGDYVKLKAMSHSERFDAKMEAVQLLEAAMEEALDQDEVVVWPAPEGQGLVTRDLDKFAAQQRMKYVCCLPLRAEDEPVAVLACERNTQPFAEVELRLLTLCADLSARRLADLKRHDRWIGARLAAAARERAAALIGPKHTGAKLLGVALAAVSAFLVFGRIPYRVEAPFTLDAENAAFLSAPFTGYIDDVKVEPGSELRQGDVLATLDSRDLLLEEAAALADQTRFVREAEKASAADKIAEMRIAQAQAEQARARLELIKHRLKQATITAPFESVVVEGDLKKRIGAPVHQGDVLFKVTRLDQLYIECQVREQDAHELRTGAKGEVAFASVPKLHFPVRIERIEPVAQAKDSGNAVVVRCAIDSAKADWWRPGMRGVAKLEAGRRSPLWALLHRTVDFLRMSLWW